MNNLRNRIIIGCVCSVILIASLVTYLIVSNSGESEIRIEDFANENLVQEENTVTNQSEDSESASTEIGKTVKESKNEMEENEIETEASLVDKDSMKNEGKDSEEVEETSTNLSKDNKEDAENKPQEEKNVNPEFCAPIKGEIIREFASESLVYSNTLQEWITHNGIDIKADKTSVVTSAANGTVYAIKNDPRYGLTVIINHDGGYQTIYSNLLTSEFVVQGEKIKAGQTIGTVGNSATFEISDDYHLHFEILKDGKYIDPTNCISF